jgi:serine/threonine protein phosphatase PrpC
MTVGSFYSESDNDASEVIHIITAHVGDSRAMIGNIKFHQPDHSSSSLFINYYESLTRDHRPDDNDELYRICNNGGVVIKTMLPPLITNDPRQTALSRSKFVPKQFVLRPPPQLSSGERQQNQQISSSSSNGGFVSFTQKIVSSVLSSFSPITANPTLLRKNVKSLNVVHPSASSTSSSSISRVYVRGERFPGLAMSRALGDLNGYFNAGISSTPDIGCYKINLKQRSPSSANVIPVVDDVVNQTLLTKQIADDVYFLVVCSDGVWEFLNETNIMMIIKNVLESDDELRRQIILKEANVSLNKIAVAIADAARQRWHVEEDGNVVDDITVIISAIIKK